MPAPTDSSAAVLYRAHQKQFHQRWQHLNDQHVRTLAWLLDAPGLLDADALAWRGRVAQLGPADAATHSWLAALDAAPQALHTFLARHAHTRLGRYAEELLAFYLQQQGALMAHGLQVRAEKGATIGEFDFLLREGDGLLHWEFATKLYLLEASRGDSDAQFDYFVGPNLADTLGLKLRKIMERQLSLALHPAAQHLLMRPVRRAQALVKGWLFYHGRTPMLPYGIAPGHCRGYWCTLDELLEVPEAPETRYLMLPRLSWLVPAKAESGQLIDREMLRQSLDEKFDIDDATPVLVASMAQAGDVWLETDRGFIVPPDWRRRAREKVGA